MGGGTSTVSSTDDVNVPEQLGEQGPLPVIVSVTLVVAAVGCAPNAICHCVLAPGGVIVCDREAGRALAVIVTAPLKPPVVFSVTIAFALPPGGFRVLRVQRRIDTDRGPKIVRTGHQRECGGSLLLAGPHKS